MLISRRICDMCGEEFNDWDKQENFGFHYNVGYGSKYDGNRIHLDFCCTCFDKLMDYILPQCKTEPAKLLMYGELLVCDGGD